MAKKRTTRALPEVGDKIIFIDDDGREVTAEVTAIDSAEEGRLSLRYWQDDFEGAKPADDKVTATVTRLNPKHSHDVGGKIMIRPDAVETDDEPFVLHDEVSVAPAMPAGHDAKGRFVRLASVPHEARLAFGDDAVRCWRFIARADGE